jgi:hypothetical protein
MSAHAIQLAIREAAAHERTASKAEDTYAMKMKAAGASMFAAFKLACEAAPEFQGRRLDDKAMSRIYASTRPRPWWDTHLAAAGLVNAKGAPDRDRAKRLIQWDSDPSAAQARYMTGKVQQLAAQKRLSQQRVSETRGMNSRPKPAQAREASIERHAERITQASLNAAVGGRELPSLETRGTVPAIDLQNLLGECSRIQSAVKKVPAASRGDVFEILRVTAREIEGYAS